MCHLFKRVLDLAVSLCALVVLAPIFAVLAALVRLSSEGPAFFRQTRLGKNGAPFLIVKFRTMYVDCIEIRNADGSAKSSERDPRVTPLGRWLRKASLDELPQLWNVLAGEMSLVGPRPDQADQLRYYTAADHKKLEMKPGITGLAQVNGRNRISWECRRKLDLRYVESWSFALDLSILFKTIPYVLFQRDIHEEHCSDKPVHSISGNHDPRDDPSASRSNQ